MNILESNKSEIYNTAINVIGGLKDCSVIFKAIEAHCANQMTLKEMINEQNEFHLRTEKSKTRIEREVRNVFLRFLNDEHFIIIRDIFCDKVPQQDKQIVLLWQFAINNRLFKEITSQVYIKAYFAGRSSISKHDIIGFLKELIHKNASLQNSWSEITINTLATKYLNLMSKLGFMDTGRIKTFKLVKPSSEATVLFLYFAALYSNQSNNIFNNEFLPLSFISTDELHNRLKKLSIKGYFDMNFNGVSLNIELKHSYKGICNVLYH